MALTRRTLFGALVGLLAAALPLGRLGRALAGRRAPYPGRVRPLDRARVGRPGPWAG